MTHSFSPKKFVTYWLYLGILLVLGMVVIGGITRLTHSGLSMVHWSFAGSLPPSTEAAWQQEFTHYQASPEFKEVHNHFSLEDFKSIYWWEYIHRMFGRMIGMVFLLPFAFFLWKKWIPKDLLKHFFIILGLGAFQAFLGWFMVKSGLVDVPRVSQYRLAAHLSIRAGWIHNTWPLMDGYVIAPAVTVIEPLISNFFEGRSGVQFIHRTLGMIVLVLALLLWRKSKAWRPDQRLGGMILSVTIGLQFILGVTTLLMEVPIYMGVIHQVFAMVVLLSVVYLYHQHSFQRTT